ncbi:transposase [bacterium]|nr:transposase [bacterium]
MDLKPLEELFRAEVFKFLKKEGKIKDDPETDGLEKLRCLELRVSLFMLITAFVLKEETKKAGRLLPCSELRASLLIIRNFFSTERITYIEKTGKVLYRSIMQKGKNKKNLVLYSAEEFIAAITQHIPKKNFQNLC